jgi:hypothetical protein
LQSIPFCRPAIDAIDHTNTSNPSGNVIARVHRFAFPHTGSTADHRLIASEASAAQPLRHRQSASLTPFYCQYGTQGSVSGVQTKCGVMRLNRTGDELTWPSFRRLRNKPRTHHSEVEQSAWSDMAEYLAMLNVIVVGLSLLAVTSSSLCSPMLYLFAAVMAYKLPMMLTSMLCDDGGLSSVFWQTKSSG